MRCLVPLSLSVALLFAAPVRAQEGAVVVPAKIKIGDVLEAIACAAGTIASPTVGSVACAMAQTDGDKGEPLITVSNGEALESAGSISFNVTRTGKTDQMSSVNFTTAAGTAQPGSDFQPFSSMLSFMPGETFKTLTIQLVRDTAPEPTETFTVQIAAGTNCRVANPKVTATIKETEQP